MMSSRSPKPVSLPDSSRTVFHLERASCIRNESSGELRLRVGAAVVANPEPFGLCEFQNAPERSDGKVVRLGVPGWTSDSRPPSCGLRRRTGRCSEDSRSDRHQQQAADAVIATRIRQRVRETAQGCQQNIAVQDFFRSTCRLGRSRGRSFSPESAWQGSPRGDDRFRVPASRRL